MPPRALIQLVGDHFLPKTRDTEKKNRLLRKALHLFARDGYAAVGVRRLAEEAGISIGMVRLHFGSKDGLREQLDNLVIEAIQNLYDRVEIDPKNPDPQQFIQHSVEFSKVERDVLLYLRASLIEQSPRASEMAARLFEITKNWVSTFDKNKLLVDGVDKDTVASFMFYNLIGPLIIEPYSRDLFGRSVYNAKQVKLRNELLLRAMTTGILKCD